MNKVFRSTKFYFAAAFLLFLSPSSVLACVACFGKSDSKMAEGMNMGILSLLVVITTVLFAMACFFVFLAKRAAATSDSEPVDALKQMPATTGWKPN